MSGVLSLLLPASVGTITAVIKSGTGGGSGSGAGAPALFGNTTYPNATITPSALHGLTFVAFDAVSGTCDFRLEVSGNPGQSVFRQVRVEDSGGAVRTFLSSAATYAVTGGGNGFWTWNASGSDPVWLPSDDSETKIIQIIF